MSVIKFQKNQPCRKNGNMTKSIKVFCVIDGGDYYVALQDIVHTKKIVSQSICTVELMQITMTIPFCVASLVWSFKDVEPCLSCFIPLFPGISYIWVIVFWIWFPDLKLLQFKVLFWPLNFQGVTVCCIVTTDSENTISLLPIFACFLTSIAPSQKE